MTFQIIKIGFGINNSNLSQNFPVPILTVTYVGFPVGTPNATEQVRTTRVSRPKTVVQALVDYTTNTFVGTQTGTLRKNGADTTLTATIPNVAGLTTINGSVGYNTGDTYSFELDCSAITAGAAGLAGITLGEMVY